MNERASQRAGVVSRGSRRLALRRLAAAWGATAWRAADAEPAVAQPLHLPALRRGLNLTHWFEYEQAQSVSPRELLALARMGIDHVRIPVDPVVGGWRPVPGARPGFLPALREAIDSAQGAGLDVVVDLHMTGETKQRIESSAEAETALVALWSELAGEFGNTAPTGVAFELFNEPQYYGQNALRWPAVQRRLLDAVRARAPKHLVLLSGNEGGSFDGLRWMPPLPDPAVAWVYHDYDPYLFTHQGAAWLDPRYTTAGLRRDVRYPASLAATHPSRLTSPHPRAAGEWAEYLAADWGPARLRAHADQAGAFARSRGVRLLCNEFGVIRANVDPASRYRWIADMRRALEANGIGWTLWDYTDIFGITRESAQASRVGERTLDPEAILALGLASAAVR